MTRPVLTEGDCFLIDKVLTERIDSEGDRILVKALQETLRRLRAVVAEKASVAVGERGRLAL